jgi:hypothetical protein
MVAGRQLLSFPCLARFKKPASNQSRPDSTMLSSLLASAGLALRRGSAANLRRCSPGAGFATGGKSARALSYQQLDDAAVEDALRELGPNWRLTKGSDRTALASSFEFDNFVEAWSFMSGVALQVRAILRFVAMSYKQPMS